MSAQKELAELLSASAVATDGPWRWSENGNLVVEGYDGSDETQEIAAVYTERDDDLEPANAALIRQAVNFIRHRGPPIAELIEAVAAEAACEEALRNRWRPRDRAGKEVYDADRDALRKSIKRKAAALRKLTEPKA